MSHFDIIEQLKNPKRFTEEEIRQHYNTTSKGKGQRIGQAEKDAYRKLFDGMKELASSNDIYKLDRYNAKGEDLLPKTKRTIQLDNRDRVSEEKDKSKVFIIHYYPCKIDGVDMIGICKVQLQRVIDMGVMKMEKNKLVYTRRKLDLNKYIDG